MPDKTNKKVKVPRDAKRVDENMEKNLREKDVTAGVVQSFFMDRPLQSPFGWTISQMNRQLKIGGRIYVTPEVNKQVRNVLEIYYGRGNDEDELIVYGGEKSPDVRRKPKSIVEEELDEPEAPEEEAAEDTPSESWGDV